MSILPWRSRRSEAVHSRAEWVEEVPSRLYSVLSAYYHNLDVYSDVQAQLYTRDGVATALKAVRNPAHRAVEFYAAKLWPGTLPEALPIVATDDAQVITPALVEAIQQVWTWSNWASQKQVAARWFAIYGDLFIKVAQRPDRSRVYFELLRPEHVTDFDTDERGYLTYCRIDVPQVRRERDKTVPYTHTEVWDKAIGYRMWEHEKAAGGDIDSLGEPLVTEPLTAFGIDFVPIVHAKFRDVGNPRGDGVFKHALDKIDEANRQATRLHQMLFRHNSVLWALEANSVDRDGRPLPPPRVTYSSGGTVTPDAVPMGDESMLNLPGMSKLVSLVPNINYAAALDILNAQLDEIEKDMPELAYYRLREMAEVSGVAIRMLLGDAIGRLLEARGNAEAALIRADQMAVTIGMASGLFDTGIGSYEDGDLDHKFAEREVIEMTPVEEATQESTETSTLVMQRELGLSKRQALTKLGYEKAEVDAMLAESEAEAQASAEAAARAFDAGRTGLGDNEDDEEVEA